MKIRRTYGNSKKFRMAIEPYFFGKDPSAWHRSFSFGTYYFRWIPKLGDSYSDKLAVIADLDRTVIPLVTDLLED